jgi:hypothetical protein
MLPVAAATNTATQNTKHVNVNSSVTAHLSSEVPLARYPISSRLQPPPAPPDIWGLTKGMH